MASWARCRPARRSMRAHSGPAFLLLFRSPRGQFTGDTGRATHWPGSGASGQPCRRNWPSRSASGRWKAARAPRPAARRPGGPGTGAGAIQGPVKLAAAAAALPLARSSPSCHFICLANPSHLHTATATHPLHRRTPHSPGSSGGVPSGSMASPRASPTALVRPVTARTWQALAVSPAAAPDEPRRMSVYTNDLYNNSGGGAAAEAPPRPASPLYQPASARPGTPTPRSAERLQQQRIATPSRLQAEGAASPSQRLAAVTGAPGAGLSTANVPAQEPREKCGGASPREKCGGASPHMRSAADARPVTAPAQPHTGGSSPLRVTTFSLAALHAAPAVAAAESPRPSTAGGPIPGSSIAVDSPRVRQQVLGHFAGAVPAGAAGHSRNASGGGTTNPLGASPRPTLHGERGRGSGGGGPTARPSTPSFRPVVDAAQRPATSMATVQPQASGPEHFSIRAVHQAAGSGGAPLPSSLGAFPQPPMTAPPKAPTQPLAQGSQPPVIEPGSLASFGIAAGAFVSAAPKAGARSAEGEAAALPAPRALTREAMLASASFARKADLR